MLQNFSMNISDSTLNHLTMHLEKIQKQFGMYLFDYQNTFYIASYLIKYHMVQNLDGGNDDKSIHF